MSQSPAAVAATECGAPARGGLSTPWAYGAALLLILASALVIRAENLTAPWIGMHNAWGGGFYGNVARNLVRYRLTDTHLAPVVSSGVVDPSEFELYYHHPPLTMWLTAAGFAVFGVHEWVARLAPIAFSLATIVLVANFARRLYGRVPALTAALFLAIVPADAYYAAHIDPNGSMSIFFTTLAVERYERWHTTRRGVDHLIAVIAIALGCATGWFTYLILPGILAHAAWSARPAAGHRWSIERGALARLLALPLAACVVLGLFFLHRSIAFAAGNSEIYNDIGTRLLQRTVGYEMSRSAIMARYVTQIGSLYALPFMLLMLAWAVTFIRDVRRHGMQDCDWWIPLLLSYPVLYAIAFPGHLPNHNFFVRPYAPGVAMASALIVGRLAAAVPADGVRRAVTAALIVVTCGVAFARTRALHAMDDYALGASFKTFGDIVHGVTTPRDHLFLPMSQDPVFQYYLDRPVTFGVDTPEKLAAAAARTPGRHLVVVPAGYRRSFPTLFSYLEQRYTALRNRDLYIFEGPTDATD